jgi:tetratricopeptide (TPR) repeat protein
MPDYRTFPTCLLSSATIFNYLTTIMKFFIPVIIYFLLPSYALCNLQQDSLLAVLKKEILKKKEYDSGKEQKIERLRVQLLHVSPSDLEKQYLLCDQLYWEYKDYVFDSAHVYTKRLLNISSRLKHLPRQYESRIKLGFIQVSCGMFKEAFDGIDQMDTGLMPNEVKFRYYQLKTRAFTRLSMYNTNKFYSPVHQSESMVALICAIQLAKPRSFERLSLTAVLYNNMDKQDEAAACYRKLLRDKSLTDHQKAIAAHNLSNLTEGTEKRSLFTLSAIYDVRTSTKETLAIFRLGEILFREGNIEDAEFLLKEASAQALFYGNKLHNDEISIVMREVEAEKLIRLETDKNHTLTVLIGILAFAIIATAITFIVVYRKLQDVKRREAFVNEQNRQLDHLNKRLTEDAIIKEEYIGYFFQIVTGYIQKLEKIKRSTDRMIRHESYKELSEIAKGIDIRKERTSLFHTFDNIFLKLFPNFISSFNSLLREEDQIIPKKTEVLNTSLRIFALVRLGIKDSQTIANILENTISTIYTYKFRIKSKAIVQGEEFDRMVMEIKFNDQEKQTVTQ